MQVKLTGPVKVHRKMHCRMLLEEGATKMYFRGQEARICGSRRYRECQRFNEQEQTPHKPVDKP
jgi:hypothetical protein